MTVHHSPFSKSLPTNISPGLTLKMERTYCSFRSTYLIIKRRKAAKAIVIYRHMGVSIGQFSTQELALLTKIRESLTLSTPGASWTSPSSPVKPLPHSGGNISLKQSSGVLQNSNQTLYSVQQVSMLTRKILYMHRRTQEWTNLTMSGSLSRSNSALINLRKVD